MKASIKIHRLGLAATIVFALVYSLIPWPAIYFRTRGFEMHDRLVYETKVLTNNLRTDFFEITRWLDYLLEEYIWNFFLSYYVRVLEYSPDSFFALVSFLSLLTFSLMVRRLIGTAYIVFLVNPLVVDFAFSQLRLSLAISVLCVAYLVKDRSKVLAIFFAGLTPLIHTASVIFLFMFFVAFITQKKIDTRPAFLRDTMPLLLCGVLLSAAIGPLREEILSAVGDRRADYVDISSSVLYLSFWVGLFICLLVDYRRSVVTIESRISIIVLTLVATNILTAGYSTRFIVATFPFLLFSIAEVFEKRNIFVLLTFVTYSAAQWAFWLKI